jgi:hypothetical protein
MLMLLLPFLAMQVTDEVKWGIADFVIFGAMLAGVGGTYELMAWKTSNTAYRSAVGIALAAAFLLAWINLAVGIIGSEESPANLLYAGVLVIGLIGAVIARFQPHGMARALVAMALAQTVVAVLTFIARLDVAGPSSAGEIVILTGVFVALWLGSAWLFHKASQEPVPTKDKL